MPLSVFNRGGKGKKISDQMSILQNFFIHNLCASCDKLVRLWLSNIFAAVLSPRGALLVVSAEGIVCRKLVRTSVYIVSLVRIEADYCQCCQ
jgi:hypothetical protein